MSAASNLDNLEKIFRLVESRLLGLLSDDSARTRMFTLRTLTIIFTSHMESVMTEFLVRAAKEVSDVLDDESQENREESVRCLGAYLHCVSARLNNVDDDREKLVKAVTLALKTLVLHMDDDSEVFRDIILGCLITLPHNLHHHLIDHLDKAINTHRHKQHIETLQKTLKQEN